jgi:hypothetical protein
LLSLREIRILRKRMWRLGVVFLFVASGSRGQQQSTQQAAPPDRPIDSRIGAAPDKNKAQDQDSDLQNVTPDANSLGGAFDFTLGEVERSRSYWQPLFSVASIVDTDPLTSGQATRDVTSWSALYGGIDLRRKTRQSDTILSYLGGGLISNDGSENSSVIQQFEFGEKVGWGRSTLSLFDLFDQLPETSFGFYLPLSVSLPAGQDLLLQPVFTANQSILTTQGERIGNASVAQFDQALTPRSSLTFVGAYSLLHFIDGGSSLNFGEVTVQGSFDHQLTRRSTVGMLYRFNELQIEGFGSPIDAHTVQLSYGQRIAGRLALRLAAGPGISLYRAPATTGAPGGTTSPTRSTSQNYWTLDASLTYQQRRTLFGLAYDHSLSGGGGVLPAAITDQVSGSVTTQFSTAFNGGLTAGYARNTGLNNLFSPLSVPGQIYNYWFGGVTLSHPWGRWTNLNLRYETQYQNSNANFCIGTACQRNFLRQTGSIGFTWRARPVPVQ